jgi:hypothetical protein
MRQFKNLETHSENGSQTWKNLDLIPITRDLSSMLSRFAFLKLQAETGSYLTQQMKLTIESLIVFAFGETRCGDNPIPLCCFYETEPSPVGKLVNDKDQAASLNPERKARLDKNTKVILIEVALTNSNRSSSITSYQRTRLVSICQRESLDTHYPDITIIYPSSEVLPIQHGRWSKIR